MTDKYTQVDVGDEVEVIRQKNRVQVKVELERLELKDILSTRPGRDFVFRILGYCELYKGISAAQVEHSNYFNGKRAVGLILLDECLAADPMCEIRMKQEALEKDRK